ncbi:hypothetical protein EVAR_48832_1 [Eumeta japonica]|uniref:Endonuclease/exonuclease/phosphatase domain-containing protein n=1 Tax=Eumeta variegata TaxID=151549 RepID=A0A4C1YA65_EUMVA|nr:hypothetical protein EVAR_48832_1 [Eumeta japonica]
MELETDADTESTAQDNREVRKAKRKIALLRMEQPDALIIRPAEKAKYAEILRRIKKDVPQDQTRDVVDKVQKTSNGNMLITLSRKSADKGQALLKTIQSILKEEAQVICKGPEEQLEIRDIDEETTKNDVREALQEAAGDDYKIPEEVIKIRPAYRGTQTASVRLPAATAQKILRERQDTNRLGELPYQSSEDSTTMLQVLALWTHYCSIKIRLPGYRSSVWFWSMPGLPRSTTEADEQTNMKILQLNINHCEAAHDLLIKWTGAKQTNARGRELLEAFSTLDIVLLNSGDRPTYTKGDASSIVDLTFVSTSLAASGEIFDPEVFNSLDSDPIETKCAEDHTKALMMRVTQACDASMPRKRVMNSRPAWKQQRLVPKGKKPPEEPSSYRPLCMLDTAGKIFERIIHQRIDAVVDPLLADNQ